MSRKRIIAASLSAFLALGSILPPTLAAPVAEAPTAVDVARAEIRATDVRTDNALQLDGVAQQEVLTTVIPLVKAKVQVPERLSQFSSSFYLNKTYTIDLVWSLPPEQQGVSSYEELRVTTDSSGRIMGYSHYADSYSYNNTDYQPRLPKMSRSEALDLAVKALARLCPDIVDQLAEQPQPGSDYFSWYNESYSFYFPRQIDGIPVEGQGVRLEIDGRNARVSNLYRSWIDQIISVQPQSNLKSVAEIKEAFRTQVGLELAYTSTFYSPQSDRNALLPGKEQRGEPYLVYRVNNYGRWDVAFDAVTGELKPLQNVSGAYITSSGVYATETSMKQSSYDLMPAEREAVEQLEGLLSAEQLQAKIAAIDLLLFDNAAALEGCSYYKDSDGRYYAQLNWRLLLSDEELLAMGFNSGELAEVRLKLGYSHHISASLDAKSGELLSFYRYDNMLPYYASQPETKEGLSEAELKAIAEEFLLTYKADLFAKTRYTADHELSDIRPLLELSAGKGQSFPAYFNWIRQENGLDYSLNSMSVNVDALSGKITSFNQSWQQNLVFPEPKNLIGKEAAERIFLEALEPQLVYRCEADAEVEDAWNAVLCYTNAAYPQVVVAAGSGMLLTAGQGDLYRAADQPRFSDLVNHPARSKIEAMVSMGMLDFIGSEFKPEAKLTQQEYLLFLSTLQGSSYYLRESQQLQRDMQSRRVIDAGEYQPDAEVSAAQALRWLLRYVNHREVAELQGIFQTSAALGEDLAGYAAIGWGLGLIDLQTWNPNSSLTRLDAALLLYSFLARP